MEPVEGISSEFDYFKPAVKQRMILAEYDDPIGVDNPVTKYDQAISFTIPKQDNVYRDLNNSYMVLKVKVTKANGGALTAGTDAVAPANLLFSSLFKSVEVKLNGVLVSHANTLHAYRAYIETLLTYNSSVLDTRGICEGWTKDDAAKMNTVTVSGGAENSGHLARHKWICGSGAVLTLIGRPHADLFHQDLDIPDNVDISLKFNPNDIKFVLNCATGSEFKLEPVEQRFYVRSKRLAPEIVEVHKALAVRYGGYRIPITKVVMNLHDVSSAAKEVGSLVPGDCIPSRVVLAMTTATAINGAFAENPFYFAPNGLTDLQIVGGGEMYPHEALKMNFTTGDYEQAYISTLGAIGLDTGNRGITITPSEWASAYNIYAFKLLPGPIGYTGEEPASGHCTAKLSFATAVAGLQLIVYAEVPSAIVISPEGKVSAP
jgi:hypothetical protein